MTPFLNILCTKNVGFYPTFFEFRKNYSIILLGPSEITTS